MCGRFTQQFTWGQLHHLYSLSGPAPLLNFHSRYNGAPTQAFAVCRLDQTGRRTIVRLRWGLVPFWAKDIKIGSRLINARAESVHFKPSFSAAFRSRRCLVPANGWFEWKRAGPARQPWFVALARGSPLSLAALWERWEKAGEPVESFTIITTAASPALADIHERQPAVIPPGRFTQWLDPASPLPQLLDLVREPCAGPFEPRAVSTRVNRVSNDDPGIRGLCAVGNSLKSQGVQGGVKNILPQGHSGLSRVWQRAEAGMAGFHPKGGTRGCRIY